MKAKKLFEKLSRLKTVYDFVKHNRRKEMSFMSYVFPAIKFENIDDEMDLKYFIYCVACLVARKDDYINSCMCDPNIFDLFDIDLTNEWYKETYDYIKYEISRTKDYVKKSLGDQKKLTKDIFDSASFLLNDLEQSDKYKEKFITLIKEYDKIENELTNDEREKINDIIQYLMLEYHLI